MPPKSILKKTSQPSPPLAAPQQAYAPRPQHSRHYQTALHHANLIQARKDVEATVLAALEELIYFPTSSNADPRRPAPSDLARFQLLIRPFTPSDYDELFVERSCVERCGYVFCPRPCRSEPNRGPVRLVQNTGTNKGFRPVAARQAETWCSRECARRAMFIKVQLSETPAWERIGGQTTPIQVLDEGAEELLEEKMVQDKVVKKPLETAMAELALERGETKSSTVRMDSVMAMDVVETSDVPIIGPRAVADYGSGSAIEGYEPRKV